MKLTFVLFYDDYCPTCEDVMPHWERFKALHEGEALFVALKKDEVTAPIFRKFGVSWVPTVLVFPTDDLEEPGKPVKRLEGFFTDEDLERLYRKALTRTGRGRLARL